MSASKPWQIRRTAMIWVYIPFSKQKNSSQLFEWAQRLSQREDVKGVFGWGVPFNQLRDMKKDDELWVMGHTNATTNTMSTDHKGSVEIDAAKLVIRIFDDTQGAAAPRTLTRIVLAACEAGQNPDGFAQLVRKELERGGYTHTKVMASNTNVSKPDEWGGRLFHQGAGKRSAVVQYR
jgi:hypothetical protein